jgi:hypothetical protein
MPALGKVWFSTILKANGEDVKSVQELFRHANRRQRAAQSRVVKRMVPNLGKRRVPYTLKMLSRVLIEPGFSCHSGGHSKLSALL